ncbi:MAG: hypothetical protein OEW16_06175 [Gammaproteobacteria bacterium]|nr:hypothetical protein [Gammaproteobacteria bacterium]
MALGHVVGARQLLTAISLATVIANILTASAPLIAATGVIFLTLLFARGVLGFAQSALFPVISGRSGFGTPRALGLRSSG